MARVRAEHPEALLVIAGASDPAPAAGDLGRGRLVSETDCA